MIWFVIASVLPTILVCFACYMGGVWPLIALMVMTVGVFFMDRLGRHLSAGGSAVLRALPLGLALLHLLILCVVVPASVAHPLPQMIFLMLTCGLILGQISHPAAHELIHAKNKWHRRAGQLIYSSLLMGHHVSAHMRVHHTHVATPADPNTARHGEGFHTFLGRAWIGSFRAGFRAEQRLRQNKPQTFNRLRHPYVSYLLWGLISLGIVTCLAGPAGLGMWVFVSIYAQTQILMADYVQHYGLQRRQRPDGSLEPVKPEHSWNAPHWYSSAMMLNAPRHSDHHVRPTKTFPELHLTQDMPTLPYALPVMAVIALCPPVWHRIMTRRLLEYANPD